jgi:hypothetical protein
MVAFPAIAKVSTAPAESLTMTDVRQKSAGCALLHVVADTQTTTQSLRVFVGENKMLHE